jgi:molybdopterin synthase sulfur carrier subunit
VARLRLFAQAREAAGTGEAVVDGETVGQVLDGAVARFGSGFEQLLVTCRVWVNGEPAQRDDPVSATDELAVLPPVSGGA